MTKVGEIGMVTAEFVQLAPTGRTRHWPVLIPRSLFTRWQPVIGARATLVWLNLYEMAEAGVETEFVSVQAALAARMDIRSAEAEEAARTLDKAGLLQRSGGRWTVLWPGEEDTAAAVAAVEAAAAETVVAVEAGAAVGAMSAAADDPDFDGETQDPASGWNSDEAALQAVVQFYHQRIGMLGPSQFEKLRFWVEEQGMSSDVVALAIEETVQSARTPRIAYVEGVLRNWYNEGIRTLADLQTSKRARSLEVNPTTEGSPNAAAFTAVDREALRLWKEMYADEYDD